MMRFKTFCWRVLTAILIVVWHGGLASALAADSCRITVVSVLAARDDTTIDPKLEPEIVDLRSIFNYTSYRQLGGESLTLETDQSGSVSLPGEHELNITLKDIHGDRARMDMRISKKNQIILQTTLQLLNRGSLFIGGPEYLNGNLIFKISSAF
ncbi:hypothetical protein [Desulfosarcina variabilis]|uniref:hypothetical protein n=1 Tax=Desulfosarcina variabilis TaxID=2300 RepID=UPI003AFB34D6